MTGLNGKIEAKTKENSGLSIVPERKQISGSFTAENNKIYFGSGISDFNFTCDADKTASCHGLFTFGVPGTIKLSGFDFIDDPDEIAEATSQSRWEFDLYAGCLIIRKRSE